MADTFRSLEINRYYSYYRRFIKYNETRLIEYDDDIKLIKDRIKETQMMVIEVKYEEFTKNDKEYIKILLANLKDFTEEFKILKEERQYIKEEYDKLNEQYDNLHVSLKHLRLEK